MFLVSALVPVSQRLYDPVSFWYLFWTYLGLHGFAACPGNPLLFVPFSHQQGIGTDIGISILEVLEYVCAMIFFHMIFFGKSSSRV